MFIIWVFQQVALPSRKVLLLGHRHFAITIVMAWNTSQMQAILDRWNQHRLEPIPEELISRIAPTHIESINLRGVFWFPIEHPTLKGATYASF